MAEEIDFEKCNFRNFRGPVTLTLTLNRVIRHTIMHHSSTSMYIPNFIEIGHFLWTDVRTDVPTDGRTFPPLMLLRRLGGVDLKSNTKCYECKKVKARFGYLTTSGQETEQLLYSPAAHKGHSNYAFCHQCLLLVCLVFLTSTAALRPVN